MSNLALGFLFMLWYISLILVAVAIFVVGFIYLATLLSIQTTVIIFLLLLIYIGGGWIFFFAVER